MVDMYVLEYSSFVTNATKTSGAKICFSGNPAQQWELLINSTKRKMTEDITWRLFICFD